MAWFFGLCSITVNILSVSLKKKKNREVTSNNSADDTNRRNAYDSKTKSKIYISRFDFQAHTM